MEEVVGAAVRLEEEQTAEFSRLAVVVWLAVAVDDFEIVVVVVAENVCEQEVLDYHN